MSMPAWHCWCR